ncbi:glycosyltransferase [Georgenia alba]|uniref:Glycosyltransferase n=1 Tax=Georgenia alba TaxID=2233858 RepID=A0ABW2Q6L8_9MICO
MAASSTVPSRPTTLAVVVSAGVSTYLPRTLRALTAQTHHPDVVLVVDVGAAGREVGTGVPVHEAVTEAGLEDVTRVRVVHAPEATTFGEAVRLGLEGYHALVERAARRARKREATGGWSGVTGELNPVTTGEMRAVGVGGAVPEAGPEWLWLLHDDSAPAPEALDRLLHVAESGRSVAIAGAKQRDWHHPDRLLEVGTRVTRTARRVPDIEPGEIDQGQHDHREDVLAVGIAGALVRHSVWDELEGTDPALGPFGDGLELSRRARLAGHRVVVVPTAVVFHARASYLGLRGGGPLVSHGPDDVPDPRRSYLQRRRAQIHNALLAAGAPAVPFLAVWFLLLGALRSLWRVTTKELGLAGAELGAPLAVLAQPGEIWRARRRVARTRRIPARALTSLHARAAEIRNAKRDVRRSQIAARKAASAPSELEIAERAALARRRRITGSAVLVLLVAVGILAYADLVVAGPLTGGALRPLDVGAGELWSLARSDWVVHADGRPGPVDPLLQVLAVAMLPLAPFGASAHVLLTTLVVLSVPLAGLGAWFAAGAASRSVGLRSLATVAWAFSPVLLLAGGQGRVGPLLAHALLPLVALGVARAVAVDRRDEILSGMVGAQRTERARAVEAARRAGTAPPPEPGTELSRRTRAGSIASGAGAALALAAAAAAAPVILPAAVVVVVLMALVVPRRRLVLLAVPIPAVVLLGPLLVAASRDVEGGTWRLLLGGGVPYAAGAPGDSWLPLLGWPSRPVPFPVPDGGTGAVALLAQYGMLAGGATLLLGACLALLRGTRRALAVRGGWLVALVGLVLALVAVRTDVGVGTGLDGMTQLVRAWPGPAVSLVVLGLLTAVVAAGDGLRHALATRSFGWLQVGTSVLAAVVAAGPVLTAVGWVVALRTAEEGRPSELLAVHGRGAPPVPAVAAEMQGSPDRSRVLALVPSGTGVRAEIWRDAGPQLSEPSATGSLADLAARAGGAADPAEREIAELVAATAVGAGEGVGQVLGDHAIGVVLVPHEATFVPAGTEPTTAERSALVERLDNTAGLERVTENESGAVWRVARSGADSADSVARARVVDADGAWLHDVAADVVGTRTDVSEGPEGRRLVLAERADPGWRAWYDGEALRATTAGWRQAFELPPENGTLTVSYTSPSSTLWAWAQAVVIGLTVLLALPVRRRRTEVDT